MTPREAHHNSHHSGRPAIVVAFHHAATTGKTPQLKSLTYVVRTSSLFQDGTAFARSGRALHCASDFLVLPTDCMDETHAIRAVFLCALRSTGVCSCVLFTGDRSQARPELADRLRKARRQIQNINKISERARTKLSGPSLASTGTGSAFAISPSWHFPKRQKPTWRSRRGTTRAHAGAGLLTTPNPCRSSWRRSRRDHEALPSTGLISVTTQVQIQHQARQARLQRFAAAARKFELSKVVNVEAELKKIVQPVPEPEVRQPDNAPLSWKILRAVSQEFDMTVSQMRCTSQHYRYVTPRHFAVGLMAEMTDLSWPKIGALLGGRDHSTALHSWRRYEVIASEEAIRNRLDQMKADISNG
jgi:hypothetical protein